MSSWGWFHGIAIVITCHNPHDLGYNPYTCGHTQANEVNQVIPNHRKLQICRLLGNRCTVNTLWLFNIAMENPL